MSATQCANDFKINIEIITIGREILDGRVVDTNSSYLGEKLNARGFCPRYAQRVDDSIPRIVEALGVAQSRSNFIVVTGGLGPTSDDVTAEAFAHFLGVKLSENPEALAMVQQAFKKMQRPFTEVQRKQALLPQGCTPLFNGEGTAPGIRYADGERKWFLLPGVPREMKFLWENSLLPELPPMPSPFHVIWKTHFTSEGELQSRIQKNAGLPPPGFELCYRTRLPENHVSLVGVPRDDTERQQGKAYAEKLSTLLEADSYYSGPLDPPPELEDCVVECARRQCRAVVTVESCSGGLVAHRLTNVSGSSEILKAGFVTYDNQAKIALGVPAATLTHYGAVSAECSLAMARAGLLQLEAMGFRNGVAISTTGIAGPTGGTPEKPIGLCHLSLVDSQHVHQEKLQVRVGLTREDYKKYFSQKALNLLLSYLRER